MEGNSIMDTRLKRVHIVHTPETRNLELLESEVNPKITITTGEEIPADAQYQILVDGNPSVEFLSASHQLKALIIPWVGLSQNTREVLTRFPNLSVYNLHHNAIPTAEIALGLLFAVSKHLIPMDKALRKNDWTTRYEPSRVTMLYGKKALILGYGTIGRIIANVLDSLGVQFYGIKRNLGNEREKNIYTPKALHALLSKVEILFVTLPLTKETEGMIGNFELNLLPKDSIVINVGRGPVIDQRALFYALESGHLGGAGLDVWYSYPTEEENRQNTPPADFPFNKLSNIVFSPHRGGSTRDTEKLRMLALAESLNAAFEGEFIPNPVDIKARY